MQRFKPCVNERCKDWPHPHPTLVCIGGCGDITEDAIVTDRWGNERHVTCNRMASRGTCYSPQGLTMRVRL